MTIFIRNSIIEPYKLDHYRYIDLHWELFGDYTGELMLKPSKEVFKRTKGNFYDFLVANNMPNLARKIDLGNRIPGYG